MFDTVNQEFPVWQLLCDQPRVYADQHARMQAIDGMAARITALIGTDSTREVAAKLALKGLVVSHTSVANCWLTACSPLVYSFSHRPTTQGREIEMQTQHDRVAADEQERHRQHAEALAAEAAPSADDLAAASLREMDSSDLLDLIANTPEAEAAVADMAYAATCLSDASWVLFARRLRDAIVAEQVRREREYLKGFRSAAWGALS